MSKFDKVMEYIRKTYPYVLRDENGNTIARCATLQELEEVEKQCRRQLSKNTSIIREIPNN
jgi:hypothetical protein